MARSSTRRPRRLLIGSAVAATALALAFGPVTSAGAQVLRLSSDPYTNPASQHKTEVEPDTFAAGSTEVSAFQVGRYFSGGSSNIGFATSTDGGSSWTSGFLPGTTPDATPPSSVYARTSDPVVAYDAKHGVWLISFLGLFPNGNSAQVDVLVSRSTDGGLTWSTPVVVNSDGDFNDKNWTACDNHPSSPFYGHCYTEFDDNTLGDRIEMSTSTDGGQTWGAQLETANGAHGIGGQPVVQLSGRVIVPINGFAGQNFTVLSFISDDGGASWSKTHIVARVAFHHAAGSIRDSIPLPSADLNSSGKVFVVWQDCHFEPGCPASDIVLSTSTDGVKWSKLSRIPLDAIGSGVDHFFPGLAVRGKKLALLYYNYPNANCTTATCQLNVGYAASTDGGSSWSASTQLAGPMSLNWLPNTSQGFMVGDYFSTSFLGTRNFPAFALANAPTGSVFDEAIYTIQGGLGTGSAVRTVTDHVDASGSVTLTTSRITDQ
jgi:hypothetical protein